MKLKEFIQIYLRCSGVPIILGFGVVAWGGRPWCKSFCSEPRCNRRWCFFVLPALVESWKKSCVLDSICLSALSHPWKHFVSCFCLMNSLWVCCKCSAIPFVTETGRNVLVQKVPYDSGHTYVLHCHIARRQLGDSDKVTLNRLRLDSWMPLSFLLLFVVISSCICQEQGPPYRLTTSWQFDSQFNVLRFEYLRRCFLDNFLGQLWWHSCVSSQSQVCSKRPG